MNDYRSLCVCMPCASTEEGLNITHFPVPLTVLSNTQPREYMSLITNLTFISNIISQMVSQSYIWINRQFVHKMGRETELQNMQKGDGILSMHMGFVVGKHTIMFLVWKMG